MKYGIEKLIISYFFPFAVSPSQTLLSISDCGIHLETLSKCCSKN